MRCYDLIVEGNDLVRLSSRSVRKFSVDLLGNGRFRMNARSNRTYCDVAGSPPPPVIPIVSEQIAVNLFNRDVPLGSVVVPVAVKAGSLLILTLTSWSGTFLPSEISSITDTQGNIWQKAASCEANVFNAGYITANIWYAENCNPGMTTVTPVIATNPGNLYWYASVQEVSGIKASGSLDTFGNNVQSVSLGQNGPATVTANAVSSQANTLVAGVTVQNTGTTDPWVTPVGYTVVFDVPDHNTDQESHSDYKIESIVQQETITWLRGIVGHFASCVAVFKGVHP